MNDIVYVLKNDVEPDEIRYSLRSVCKNFPYRKIWFFGGKPEGIEPDEYICVEQQGVEVWRKVTNTLEVVCGTKGVTKDFWLFNDDFFIMKPVEDMPPVYNGTLLDRALEIRARREGAQSLYSIRLMRAQAHLYDAGYTTLNYAVHMPMLINKKKAIQTIRKFPKCAMFRSLYGNMWQVEGVEHKDVKIFSDDVAPDPDSVLLSTSDSSFREGLVGKFIRSRFPEPCKYEKG